MKALLVGILIGSSLAAQAATPPVHHKKKHHVVAKKKTVVAKKADNPLDSILRLSEGHPTAQDLKWMDSHPEPVPVFHGPLFRVKGVKVSVDIDSKWTTDYKIPSSDDLKSLVELQLRSANIPVVEVTNGDDKLSLSIEISLLQDETGLYVQSCTASMTDLVVDEKHHCFGTMHLWDGKGEFGEAGSAKITESIREWVQRISIEFANEYLKEQGK